MPHVEKSGDGGPNRQRDQTPEAKPLRQQCPCAESARAPRSERDTPSGVADEQVFGTANLGRRDSIS